MRKFFSVIIYILAVLLGAVSMVGGFIGASYIFNNIAILCICGLLLGFLITFVLGILANKIHKKLSKTPFILATCVIVLVSLFCTFTVFKPFPGPITKSVEPENTKYWNLTTGSKIGYWHYEAQGDKKSTPIIFIHGGPGAFVRDLDRDFFSKFAKEGYDVYLYDQPGAGFSAELSVDEYTINREVADLEEIRKEIGAKKVILIGQSFGGPITSAYTAEHPNNVEKAILTCPSGIRDLNYEKNYPPKTAADIITKYKSSLAENLRFITLNFLAHINGNAAENFVSQKEIKDYTTRFLPETLAQSFPQSYLDKLPKTNYGGINLLSNISLIKNSIQVSEDLSTKLKKVDVPVLILRSEYDYIAWEDERDYRELYKNNRMVYIKDSGHILWAVNEKDTYDTIKAFILDKDLPLPIYTKDENPSIPSN